MEAGRFTAAPPMSLLHIFKLAPGQGMHFEVRALPAIGERVALEVSRPDEGASRELALTLQGADGRRLGGGRVPIDGGYLAVVREVRRQLAPLAGPHAEAGLRASGTSADLEFDLVELPEHGQRQRAAGLEGPGTPGESGCEYGLP